jgi:hypothetical protein
MMRKECMCEIQSSLPCLFAASERLAIYRAMNRRKNPWRETPMNEDEREGKTPIGCEKRRLRYKNRRQQDAPRV